MSTLTPFETSLSIIRQHSPPKRTETIALTECLGRTLAEPIIAKVSRPPAAVSAMDGYAVRLQDVTTETSSLNLIGESPAGTPFKSKLRENETVRIFTGGELPPGADHVVPQELTSKDADRITINNAYSQAAHVRAKGVDFLQGAQLIAPGTRLGAAELAIAAAANYGTLQVYKPLTVALLSNGNELKPPGSELCPGEIISSNPYALAALLKSWGASVLNLGIAPDRIDAIQSHIERANEADIIVPIGGASVGDHDHMRSAFSGLGYKTIFEKVAVKPGKPTWFAQKKDQYVLGLPGNPASALVCAYLFLPSLLDPNHAHSFTKASIKQGLKANGSRTHFLRARASVAPSGQLEVSPAINQDSSLLVPFLSANCLIHQAPNGPAIAAGDLTDILMLGPL